MMLTHGEVTLVAGVAAVPVPRIPLGATVQLTPKSLFGTTGALGYSITPRVGFTITSLSVLDVSVVAYAVFA